MKNFLKIFMLATLFIIVSPKVNAFADTGTDENGITWNYTLVDGKATKVYYNSGILADTLNIPSSINGYPVSTIGPSNIIVDNVNYFYNILGLKATISNDVSIKHINIPNSVIMIESSAFHNLRGLEEITIPDSVLSMNSNCFRNCIALRTVVLSKNITNIPLGCFFQCSNLEKIELSNNVTSVGFMSFTWCQKAHIYFYSKNWTKVTNNAFSPGVVFHGYIGSDTETYASSMKLQFIPIIDGIVVYSSLQVDIEATLIDVTITPNISIVINPNTGNIVAGDIVIVNNSVAPILVKSSPSLTEKVDSYFKLSPKNKHTNWSKLNKEQSTDIAFRLTILDGWKAIIRGVKDTDTTDMLEGTLMPKTTARIGVTDVMHGNSFETGKAGSFSISWVISLE